MINRHLKFDINTEGRDFFVGDIHGEFELLMAELARRDFDFNKDRVFSVGDLIDRGDESEKCLSLVIKDWFHAVVGNHEHMMLEDEMFQTWMWNGGDWGAKIPMENLTFYREVLRKHLAHTITVDTVDGRIGVIHADPAPIWKNNNEKTFWQNIWNRDKIQRKDPTPIYGVDAVVVGHTPGKEVRVLGNVVYIDTGACFLPGKLTILEAPEVFKYIEEVAE